MFLRQTIVVSHIQDSFQGRPCLSTIGTPTHADIDVTLQISTPKISDIINCYQSTLVRGGQSGNAVSIDLILPSRPHSLRLLVERAGQVVSRDEILERVWGYEVSPSTRAVEHMVVRLRKLIEPDPERPRYLHTVRGLGYRFSPEGEA